MEELTAPEERGEEEAEGPVAQQAQQSQRQQRGDGAAATEREQRQQQGQEDGRGSGRPSSPGAAPGAAPSPEAGRASSLDAGWSPGVSVITLMMQRAAAASAAEAAGAGAASAAGAKGAPGGGGPADSPAGPTQPAKRYRTPQLAQGSALATSAKGGECLCDPAFVVVIQTMAHHLEMGGHLFPLYPPQPPGNRQTSRRSRLLSQPPPTLLHRRHAWSRGGAAAVPPAAPGCQVGRCCCRAHAAPRPPALSGERDSLPYQRFAAAWTGGLVTGCVCVLAAFTDAGSSRGGCPCRSTCCSTAAAKAGAAAWWALRSA